MKKPSLPRLTSLLGLALFGVAIAVLHHALQLYHFRDILRHLHRIPLSQKGLAALLTILSYLVMTGYDRLGVRYLGRSLPWQQVTFTSFLGYAFSNNIGLSFLSGGSVRFRLYSVWGLSAGEISRVIAFTVTTFWLGILTVAGAVFLTAPPSLVRLGTPWIAALRPMGGIIVLLIAAYLGVCALRREPWQLRGWPIAVPSLPLAFSQLILGALDWALAGAVLYVLLPAGANLSFPAFLGLFLTAQTLALISHVPGGIGVFESVMVMLIPQVPAASLLGALVVYRVIYYLIPLLVAAILLVAHEMLRRRERVFRYTRLLAGWFAFLVPQSLALLVLVGGIVLLYSGATPEVQSRLHWLKHFLPLPVMELSHFLGSLAGAGLLFLAWGLQRRLDIAYHLAALLLAAGSLFSLLKGGDYEEAIILAVMLAALLPCRRHFYRRASFFSERFTWGWMATIALVLASTVWLGLFAYRHVEYSDELWWRFAWHGDAPRFMRAMVAVLVFTCSVAVAKLLRPAAPEPELPDREEREAARQIVARAPDSSAWLAMLGDKHLLFNPARTAFLMYAPEGRSMVAMGDPVGPREEIRELAWRFQELCSSHARWPVFYEVGSENLDIYLELGLSLLKLGEEARVPLADFSLEGGSRRGMRYARRRMDREGVTFSVVPATEVAPLLPHLQRVSNAWLASKKTREKGFSLGYFQPDYLSLCPVALLHREGEPIAFASLWPGAGKRELSVDLMRYLPEEAQGVMEFLFIELMLWGKEEGYRWFNLGMAPLAGLENRPQAPLWNRLGALLYRHGEHFYNFQGLRDYKEKFDPVWVPRYLASPGGLALPRVLANLATLISGGVKGVIGK